MGGPVLKRGSTVAVFSVSRPEQLGPFTDKDLRLAQLLMPHLRRACLLHQRLKRLRAERSGGLAALELLPTAVWLLDADGRLLFANRAGRELDQCHDGLWIDLHGMPVADDPGERQALQRCIAATIAAGRGLGVASDCVLSVRRRQQAPPLYVTLYPLGREALLHGSAAAMFILDPAKSTVPHTDALRMLYGLTPAEARLASALAEGGTLAEYCGSHRLRANTVRTHLKRALAKTDTHQQSQLVSLIARLPATRAGLR
jgi:DNA-binding CsgD family transcriptional regulator